jgi:hypothetical protein
VIPPFANGFIDAYKNIIIELWGSYGLESCIVRSI